VCFLRISLFLFDGAIKALNIIILWMSCDVIHKTGRQRNAAFSEQSFRHVHKMLGSIFYASESLLPAFNADFMIG
jgi:hypothetical protein